MLSSDYTLGPEMAFGFPLVLTVLELVRLSFAVALEVVSEDLLEKY